MSDARLVVEESCDACTGSGRTALLGKCPTCRGTGRQVRDAYAPESGTDGPTAEELEIDLLRGEILGLRRHVAMLQAECDRLANCDSHGWRNRAENAERVLAAVVMQAEEFEKWDSGDWPVALNCLHVLAHKARVALGDKP